MKKLLSCIPFLGGCATSISMMNFPKAIPMSGTILDLAGIFAGSELEWYIRLWAFTDLPASMCMDTALLPITTALHLIFSDGVF